MSDGRVTLDTDGLSKGLHDLRSRAWDAPKVIRLNAGQAEAGIRLVVDDGPFGTKS